MLTDTAIKSAKPTDTSFKLYDGQGMYIVVSKSGSKLFRIDYRFRGKRKTLSLGKYPEVSLKEARSRCLSIREQLAHNVDPSAARKAMKRGWGSQNSFQAIAEQWIAKQASAWSASHLNRMSRLLERDIYPFIGQSLISELTAPDILEVLKRIENRSAIETAHRALQKITSVFTFAVASGLTRHNPARELRGTLTPVRSNHLAAITDRKGVAALLRAIDGYNSFLTRSALQLLAYTFVRPGELRQAEWCEFDIENAVWRIPAERMKRGREHIVPLSKQAIELLHSILPLTGSGKLVFPSVRTNKRCMSNNTLTAALRRMGYTKHEMTAHGFRSIASTMLNEQGWNADAIERQLSHVEAGKVRAAYHRSQYLEERIKMMQQWANFLDDLKYGNNIVRLRTASIFNRR